MNWFQALVLGIIQGAAEFIPVSSSGHLVVLPKIFGWADQPLVFDTTVHFGTALALVLFFWKDLSTQYFTAAKDFFSHGLYINKYSKTSLLVIFILFGCAPAALIGYAFGDLIESTFGTLRLVAVNLLIGSIFLLVGDVLSRRATSFVSELNLGFFRSIIVGIFQVFALFPGISRSGSTISGGILCGLSKEDATRFSFLLSVPIVVMAATLKLVQALPDLRVSDISYFTIGTFASFTAGLVCIKWLMKYVKNNSLLPFVFYRIALAFVLIAFSFR